MDPELIPPELVLVSVERPSPAARERLRQAVAQAVAGSAARRPWRSWERPAAVVFAAAVVLFSMQLTGALAASAGAPPHSWVASE